MFIQTEETPNPATMKFLPGQDVLGRGTLEIDEESKAAVSPLATALFGIDGIKGVFLGGDFITVTKKAEKDWPVLKPAILSVIMEHFAANRPVVSEGSVPQAAHDADDGEIAKQIREILDVKVRPAVAQDGGDITFQKFEDGVVYLHMKGSCAAAQARPPRSNPASKTCSSTTSPKCAKSANRAEVSPCTSF